MFGSTVFVLGTLFWETTTKSSFWESSSVPDLDKWFKALKKGTSSHQICKGLMVAPEKLIFQGFGTSSLSPLPWKAEIRVRRVMQPLLLDEMQLYFIHVTVSAILTSLWSFAYEKKLPSLSVVEKRLSSEWMSKWKEELTKVARRRLHSFGYDVIMHHHHITKYSTAASSITLLLDGYKLPNALWSRG